jgi:putative endonuclease
VLPVTPANDPQTSGARAEEQARRFLELQGLRTVERNFRTRRGELDLVMEQGPVLVFVEVRFRKDRRFGGPLESVSPAKCRRVALAAAEFLGQRREWRDRPCRFDVAAICGDAPGQVEWIRDAFQL